MSYRQQTQQLGDHAQAQIMALYAAYQAGKLSKAEFKASVVETMLVLMETANQLADHALAALLSRQTSTMVLPVGTLSVDASDRLGKAVETILGDVATAATAFGRLAKAETLHAAQLGWGDALRQQPGVRGWTRGIHPGACDICQRLAGSVLSLDIPMYHHPGCTCIQKPVMMR